MTVNLSPVGGAGWQFFDNNGVPLSGGKLYTYEAGTTTPEPTYTSSSGNTTHTNPIVLDSAGRVPGSSEIWLTGGQPYKFLLKTSADVQLWSVDNVSGINDFDSLQPTVYNSTGNGSTVAFVLPSAPLYPGLMKVFINGVYQNTSTYSLSTATLTFSEAPPMGSLIEVLYN